MCGEGDGSATAAIHNYEQPDANDNSHGAVDRPLGLTSHKAARQDIDPLQEPDGSHQDTQNS